MVSCSLYHLLNDERARLYARLCLSLLLFARVRLFRNVRMRASTVSKSGNVSSVIFVFRVSLRGLTRLPPNALFRSHSVPSFSYGDKICRTKKYIAHIFRTRCESRERLIYQMFLLSVTFVTCIYTIIK